MKALLIDDHAIARSSLKRMLEGIRKFAIFEAANGREAIEIWEREAPSLVILDLELPDVSGVELLRCLIQADPVPRVLVCSMYDNAVHAVRCLKSGAKGYVSENVSPDGLQIAVREVLSGRSYVEKSIATQLKNITSNESIDLSEREADFLRLLAKGLSYAEIATIWGLSYKTVANTAGQIRSRLSLSSTGELIGFAAKLYSRNLGDPD